MTPAGHTPLMFDWAHDHRRRLALWIVVALLMHVGAYFLFRVVQPPASPAPPLDRAIHVLAPGSAEAARLAAFVEANDPSLAAPDRIGPVSIPDPAAPPYRPSYATAPPPLVPLPDPETRLLPPVVRDIGSVPMPNPRSTLSLPPPALDTRIAFAGGLEGRQPVVKPDLEFAGRAAGFLPPAVFLVAIDAHGRVLHVFAQESTGDRDLDDAAARRLFDYRFQEAGEGAWGTATFHWGGGGSRSGNE